MLHGEREGNGRNVFLRTTWAKSFTKEIFFFVDLRDLHGYGFDCTPKSRLLGYFGTGVIALGFGCLAIIWSLILSYVAWGMIFL